MLSTGRNLGSGGTTLSNKVLFDRIEQHILARIMEIRGACFPVLQLRYQSLYHFTVGKPIEDQRLQTLAPYHHLEKTQLKEGEV